MLPFQIYEIFTKPYYCFYIYILNTLVLLQIADTSVTHEKLCYK